MGLFKILQLNGHWRGDRYFFNEYALFCLNFKLQRSTVVINNVPIGGVKTIRP
jgi:hypothetical protein